MFAKIIQELQLVFAQQRLAISAALGFFLSLRPSECIVDGQMLPLFLAGPISLVLFNVTMGNHHFEPGKTWKTLNFDGTLQEKTSINDRFYNFPVAGWSTKRRWSLKKRMLPFNVTRLVQTCVQHLPTYRACNEIPGCWFLAEPFHMVSTRLPKPSPVMGVDTESPGNSLGGGLASCLVLQRPSFFKGAAWRKLAIK